MARLGMGMLVLAGVLGSSALGQIPGWNPDWLNASPEYLQISNLQGSYDAATGILRMAPKAGGPSATVHWNTGDDWTLEGTSALVDAAGKLYQDVSSGGIAKGKFNGVGVDCGDPALDWRVGWDFGILDAWVLTGQLDYYEVTEIFNTGLLEGKGFVTATGGLLTTLGLWPTEQTSISSFQFGISSPGGGPINISNFSTPFVGDMYLTFWPDDDHGVPEPATFALFSAGLGLASLRRRKA